MHKPITIKEIAKDLGVSFSTVSKSLNDSSEISEKTKKKVKEYAALRGYVPNQIALSLKNSATFTIGVIIPDIQNPFFAAVLRSIEVNAKLLGYRVVTFFTDEKLKEEEESLKILSKGLVDGLIVCPSEETFKQKMFDHFTAVKNMNTPVLIFDRVDEHLDFDSVSVNDSLSIKIALKHLYNEGSRNILFSSTIGNVSVGQRRKESFDRFLEEHKDVKGYVLEEADHTVLKAKLEALLKNEKIDGIMGVDIVATGIPNAVITKLGKKYIDEIALIGYVDKKHNEIQYPKISYINQHPEVMGQKAITMLVDKIKIGNSKLHNKEVIETSLVIEDTSN